MDITMESDLSLRSSSREEFKVENYVQPHYKEAYRLAIDCLVSGGEDSYQNFIKKEGIWGFLSEEEIHHITESAVQPLTSNHSEEVDCPQDDTSSTGTYWPTNSDTDPPNLDLGWPEPSHSRLQTSIELLFHPPRQNSPTIKEVIRKNMQDARQVIAIAMDVFTDVDIFKELVDASIRGVPVYILLDHDYFKSFLTMVEKQDVQIQKLRNMRVRTVKGHEYCCRSGAKFHGRMGQKFILVDCQTVFFGSYSFMWSYEKINLSIMQVITGQLVETYDEEFRTLYARSTIPTPFQTPDRQCDMRPNGKMDGYLIHSNNPFERKDHLRHTLDAVYRQTCERRSGFSPVRELEERPVVASHIRLLQETSDYYKRHSYAGERQEPACIPQLSKYGSSNWNVAADSCRYGGFSNNMDNQYESYVVHPMYRGSHMRQSYHGHDKQVLNMRQKLPSLASTSKSFLRTWRIESYLNNNNDAPFGENYDYLDQYEKENKMAPPQHSRLRSSMVFTSTIPEQPETNSYSNNSASFNNDQAGFQPNAQIYSSTQWNQPHTGTTQHDDYMIKRRSIQILENSGTNTSFNSGRDAIYASLNRTKNQFINNEPDIQQDNWYKRHSVADPRSNTYNNDKTEPSSYMYASLPRRPRDKVSTNELPRNGGYTPNLKESQISKDQRSVSHFDVKKADESTTTSGSIWQEPPSRTVSATLLDTDDSLPSKPTGVTSPRFLKKSTKKIRSLLNIPQKGDGSPKRKNGSSLKSSTDTILSDDDTVRDKKCHGSTTNSIKSINSCRFRKAGENNSAGLVGETSAPRFSTDELHQGQTTSAAETTKTQEQFPVITQNERSDATLSTSDLLPKQQVSANRLYSRFEPLCSFETKSPSAGQTAYVSTNSHATLKTRNSVFLRGEPMSDHNRYTNQQTHGHDNRFGRFIQRVGNLINKNKY
ncbi:protein FAM83B-like [Myxocyprinus asiaticus]|uniref:protein FAM83B-like n=1 Tax=Myxocyprinus asiaticus TaxID=70543 RepID=UPI002223C8EE|nr:protein FAM83B-like [Myxocyprinus asiaticus]